MRPKIILEKDGIMRSIDIYLAVSKVYPKKRLVWGN